MGVADANDICVYLSTSRKRTKKSMAKTSLPPGIGRQATALLLKTLCSCRGSYSKSQSFPVGVGHGQGCHLSFSHPSRRVSLVEAAGRFEHNLVLIAYSGLQHALDRFPCRHAQITISTRTLRAARKTTAVYSEVSGDAALREVQAPWVVSHKTATFRYRKGFRFQTSFWRLVMHLGS